MNFFFTVSYLFHFFPPSLSFFRCFHFGAHFYPSEEDGERKNGFQYFCQAAFTASALFSANSNPPHQEITLRGLVAAPRFPSEDPFSWTHRVLPVRKNNSREAQPPSPPLLNISALWAIRLEVSAFRCSNWAQNSQTLLAWVWPHKKTKPFTIRPTP